MEPTRADDGEDQLIEELAHQLDARGCSPAEVASVEADYGQPLPPSYRVFLETMGRDVGGLFGGSDIGYPDMIGLRQQAEALLSDNGTTLSLPDDALVLMMHQGYIFQFIQTDDQSVLGWSEGHHETGSHQFKVVAPSLYDFLLGEATSTTLEPEEMELHRTSTQTRRRLRHQREPCPHCSTPFASWSWDRAWGPAELNAGRERMIGNCRRCRRTYWRWSDEPDARLKRLRDPGRRPKSRRWYRLRSRDQD